MGRLGDIGKYKQLLLNFYRFYSAVEPVVYLAGTRRFGLAMDDRKKLGAIRADLEKLGALASGAGLPAFDCLSDISSDAKALGAMYVLEGASLGGQVISRMLSQHFGETIDGADNFFSGYREKTGEMWKEFCEAAENFAAVYSNHEEIIAAAIGTFESFERSFLEMEEYFLAKA